MENRKYLIKKLSPWMIDELLAFSKIAPFELIFLREQDASYNKDLLKLEERGVNIQVKPFSNAHLLKKIGHSLKFVFINFFKFRFDYNFVIGVKSVLLFLRIDITRFSENSNMHAQFATQGAILALMIRSYYTDLPNYSFTFHAHDIFFDNAWFKMLVENSHSSFSISSYNIEYVKNKYGDSDKYRLARLGVFTEEIKDLSKKERSDQKRLRFGLLSRFVEKKGIIYLLEAMKEIKETGRDDIVLLLGGDGPLMDQLKEFSSNNDLDDMVKFTGTVRGNDKVDFYNDLDVFVLPCVKLKNDMDGIPVVLMEACAYGIPLISTQVSGIPEICKNEFNGYLIQERNVEDLVESMTKMIEQRYKRQLFSTNSLLVSEEYDIQSNSEAKMKLLNWI